MYAKFLPILFCFLKFSSQNVIPISETLVAGMSNDPNKVQFYLYPNPSNPSDSDELKFNNIASITNSRFDPSKPIIIYSSGFLQNRTSDQAIKNAYLQAGFAATTNIIVVEWGDLSGNKCKIPTFFPELIIAEIYLAAVKNVEIVGNRLEEFINFLIVNGKVSGPENVHLVGQSLGAHLAGKAGFYYKKRTGKLYARITGTEAANQFFQGSSTDKRLDTSDAVFVDTIHTNDGGYGYSGAYGAVDFFVNGGKAPQPGCDGTQTFCSHNMAVAFFAKSIIDKSLLAYDCTNCPGGTEPNTPFGQYVPTSAKGARYINTDAKY